ncbi:MAG: trimethylamine methyltransferase family protein, partial [Wenzhouxiangellaceae bacterium]
MRQKFAGVRRQQQEEVDVERVPIDVANVGDLGAELASAAVEGHPVAQSHADAIGPAPGQRDLAATVGVPEPALAHFIGRRQLVDPGHIDLSGKTILPRLLAADADQLGVLHSLAAGVSADANAQAMDAIAEVGPGGHYLGCA